jgi:hypothetical protein
MHERFRSLATPAVTFLAALAVPWFAGPGAHARLRAVQDPSCPDPKVVKICVRPITVAAKPGQAPPAGGSSVDPTDAFLAKMKADLDAVWKRCCIFTDVRKGDPIELPAKFFVNGQLPVASSVERPFKWTAQAHHLLGKAGKDCLSLYFANDVRFSNNNNNLLGIANTQGNGMMVDDAAGNDVVAHELGHNLELPDNDPAVPGNLMNGIELAPGAGGGTGLTDGQCKTAKAKVDEYNRQGYK